MHDPSAEAEFDVISCQGRLARGVLSDPGMKRLWIPTLALVLCVSGFAVAADALVTSDAERLDAFLDGAGSEEASERIDAIAEYANPSELSVRVQAEGEVQVFGTGQANELSDWLDTHLDVFQSRQQELKQHSTQITAPGEARVTTRVADEDGEQTVIFTLQKREDTWRVRSMRVL